MPAIPPESQPEVDLPTLAEAKQRLADAATQRRDAQAALDDAKVAVHEALRVYDVVRGQQAGGRTLANLAHRGNNPTALRRLDEYAQTLHSSIVGVVNHDWTLGLRIDLPTEVAPDVVDELATAMRDFVRQHNPYTTADKDDKYRRKGYAYAETRAGTLAFALRRTSPAYLLPLAEVVIEEGLDDFSKQIRRQNREESENPEETYASLEAALTALPTSIFLSGLSGEPGSRHF